VRAVQAFAAMAAAFAVQAPGVAADARTPP